MAARGFSRRSLLRRVGGQTPTRRGQAPAANPAGASIGGQAPAANLTGARPHSDAALIRLQRQIMACRFEIVLPNESREHVAVARAALDEADRLEEVMTIFRDTSELTRVNRDAHELPVRTSAELFDVLRLAGELSEATQGAFDITSRPLSECWGFLKREGRRPSSEAIDQARAKVGMNLVELNPDHQTVNFRRDGVSLNLGAIGKGFALDRMGQFLRQKGVDHALLSAGASSILAIGGTVRPWEIALRSMVTGEQLATLHVTNGAVGTSGAGEQFFEVDGVRYGHVIDPRTGWPASGVLSASVMTSSAAAADALSTAFLIGGPELADCYCASHPGVLAMITPDRQSRPLTFGSYLAASVALS